MPQCGTCGASISEQDTICPDCGAEVKGAQVVPAEGEAVSPPVVPAEAPAAPPPVPSAGAARLTVKRAGTLTAEVFALGGERVVIGRFDTETGPVDVDCAALPEAPYVSRRHAEIWRDAAGQWFIKDLGSANGTFVRATGQSQFLRVTAEQAINDSDEIALGNARFEFRVS